MGVFTVSQWGAWLDSFPRQFPPSHPPHPQPQPLAMPRMYVLNGLCTSCNDRYCFEPVGGVGVCRPCRQALADRPFTDRSPRRNKSKRDKGGSGAHALDDYYASLDTGDRQRHLEALARVAGAPALVKCGAGGKPSIAVLTSAVQSLVDNWAAIGANVAVHDFPAPPVGAAHQPEAPASGGRPARALRRPESPCRPGPPGGDERGCTGLGLSTGAVDSLFDRDGWRHIGGAIESTVPMTLQIIGVGDAIDGVEGPWGRSFVATDGASKVLCYPFTHP